MALKKNGLLFMVVTAIAVCLLVYLRALSCDFINFDDPQYVYENPAIRKLDLAFVIEAFTTSYMGWWMPLTWISLALDYHFWGLDPVGYHLTNIVLHAVNAGLVVLIASRLLGATAGGRFTRWLPLLAALLWGLHPLRVESVVWVTERKDVLNGIFSLAAILCYLHYVQAPLASKRKKICIYGTAMLLLGLSLMAKPVSVVLPAIFLLLDWYPLQRLQSGRAGRILAEKIPFFLLAVASSAATLYFAAGETILVSFADYPLSSRLLVAGFALVEYLRLILWPVGLVHFYPILPELPLSYYVHTLFAAGLTMYAIYVRRERPWLLASWIAFILPLLPVLGLLQNGAQSHADRFTYLPTVLPGITLVAVIASLVERFAARFSFSGERLLLVVLCAVLFGQAVMSYTLIGYWRNSAMLWSRLIEIRPVGRAYYYRGEYYLTSGNFTAAAADLGVAVAMAESAGNPEVFNLRAMRGDALLKAGRFAEAVEEFTAAVNGYPDKNYYYHRGVALRGLGRVAEAEKDFLRAGTATGPVTWHPLW